MTVLIKRSGLTHDLKQMSSMLRRGPRSRTKTRVYDRKPLEHISSGLVFSKFKRKKLGFLLMTCTNVVSERVFEMTGRVNDVNKNE